MVGGTAAPFDGIGRSIGLICWKKFKIKGKFTCPPPPPTPTGSREAIQEDGADEPKIRFKGTWSIECKCEPGAMPDEWGGVGYPPVSPEDLDSGNYDTGGQNCDQDFERKRQTTTFPCEQRETITDYDEGTSSDVVTWIGCLGDREDEVDHEMSLEDLKLGLMRLSEEGAEKKFGEPDRHYSSDSPEGNLAMSCGAKPGKNEEGEAIANLGPMRLEHDDPHSERWTDNPEFDAIMDCMMSKMCCGGGANGASVAMTIMQWYITQGAEDRFICRADYNPIGG